jgi:hypothetical protein
MVGALPTLLQGCIKNHFCFLSYVNGYTHCEGLVASVLLANIIAMTNNRDMMVLQNCLDSQKDVPGSHIESCASSYLNAVEVVNLKVEEYSDIEDRKDPMPITVVGIKAEHEVSCMSLCPLLGR